MTETKKSSNQIVKLALILFVVSAITSGVLGVVNYFTKDIIAMRRAEARAEAYQAVLPYDGEYTSVSFDEEAWETVDAISQAGGEGYVVELTFSGAQGSINAAVGVDSAGAITGVSIIEHAETSGLGAKITEDSFRSQFVGQTLGMALSKNGGEIDSITAATISSQAIVDACNTAIEVVESLG